MTVGERVSRAGELERRYLGGTFAELCRIESPSGRERRCAERVKAELGALGVEVEEDDTRTLTGSDCGNLLAYVPAGAPSAGEAGLSARRSLLLCAHLDTVPPEGPVEPVLVDGAWENEHDGILGADNKAAIAVMLALARHIRGVGAPLDLELLFTVSEETGLVGASAVDVSRLRSELGFVFDQATPIGGVVVASPTHFRVHATLRGAAAHAGIRPEEGRSAILAAARAIAAMPLGRLDAETTANVGTIEGGSALNVVPESASILAEVRGIDQQRAEGVVAEIVDRLHEAANIPECACDLDVTVETMFSGFRLSGSSAGVRVAEAALRSCGHEPQRIHSGGGSDANALIAKGFQAVNLANGTERNHEPGERVTAAALEDMLDVAIALLAEAASLPAAAAR